jgi:hypothetical protein
VRHRGAHPNRVRQPPDHQPSQAAHPESSSPSAAGSWPVGRVVQTLALCDEVLRHGSTADGLEWLPEEGVVLTRADLATIFEDLRALIAGTEEFEPNRAYAGDIAVTIARALERDSGDD